MNTSKSAELQLRAYVTILGGSIRTAHLENGKIGLNIHIELKNSGQTPAYNFTTWISLPLIADPEISTPFGDTLPISERTGSSVVGPGASAHINRLVIFNEYDAIANGSKQIFVSGGADYTDIFGIQRNFVFRCVGAHPRILGPILELSLQAHKMGYDAT